MKKWACVAAVFLGNLLQAQSDLEPWLTGPLIAPVGTAVPYGKFKIKSYVYCTAYTGSSDHDWGDILENKNLYSVNAQFLCFFGLTPWCDFNIIPQFIYQTTSNRHYFSPGDLTVGLDFQLMEADLTPFFPGIKFAVREVFPVGNFQYLRPRKLSADETGDGTFATQFDLVFYKLFYLSRLHTLSMTVSAQYTVNTPVNVHGFNSYGGGFGTKGKVIPGNELQGIMSFELSLNRHWVLALDNVYTHSNISEFFGMPGISVWGTVANIGIPSSDQLSFAPAIEYNWSDRFGIIAGCWFSAWERNCREFRSGVVNFNYAY